MYTGFPASLKNVGFIFVCTKNLIMVFSGNSGTVLLCLVRVRALEELSEGHETHILLTFYSKFPCTCAVMSCG